MLTEAFKREARPLRGGGGGLASASERGVSQEGSRLLLSSCVIAAPGFRVPTREIRCAAGGARPDWSSVFSQRGEERSRLVAAPSPLRLPETQRRNIVSDTSSAFAGNLWQFVSALVAFILTFIVPQNMSLKSADHWSRKASL